MGGSTDSKSGTTCQTDQYVVDPQLQFKAQLMTNKGYTTISGRK